MRKLLLIRGPQGSGKSTFIRQLGLEPYAMSLDLIRRAVAAPALNPEGKWGLAGEFDDAVVNLHRSLMDQRLRRGELMVMEQAIMMKEDIERYTAMAERHRYDTLLLDFTNMPLERVIAQNAAREELIRVPEASIHRTVQRLKSTPKPTHIPVLPWSEDASDRIQAWLTVPVRDLSAYEEIVHIGDLQGCWTVLAGPNGPLRNGLDPNKFYVFVGDLLDRGLENGEVMQWFMQHVVGRPNAVILYGNHEIHLDRWAHREPAVSMEFEKQTLPQLLRAGITREDAGRLVAFTQDLLCYTYRGERVLVTHAGLPTVPAHLERVAAYQTYKGTGNWSDPVDARFDRLAPAGWTQVHGHRNHGPLPIQASPRSFNLEDSVEHGGHLRLVRLSAQGWTPEAYPNPVYKPYRAREIHEDRRHLEPTWMTQEANTHLPSELLQAMREHGGVKEKVSRSHPHIASLNFTRNIFWSKAWDDLVVKARGLFFSLETGEVVARAYDKFFNLDERPETKLDAVMANAKFPIVGYRKDNGFLGLIGYDAKHDALFFSSKSTPDSEFTTWLKTIYEGQTTPTQRESLRRYLRDNESCVAVEVIDPVNDPHMIEYPKATLTLLDVFHRSANIERLPYEQLETFGAKMGLEVKTKEIVFKNAEQLKGWYEHASQDLSYRHRQQDLEGFVLEDVNGFMVKIKLPHYAFWKTMRSAKDRLGRLRRVDDENEARRLKNPWVAAKEAEAAAAAAARSQQDLPLDVPAKRGVNHQAIENTLARYPHPQAQAFLRWTLAQPTEAMEKNILELRQAFKNSPAYDPIMDKVPWVPSYADSENEDAPSASSAPAPTKRSRRSP
jgi:predicted kinase